jgi:ketosteroid isomerase-like protein
MDEHGTETSTQRSITASRAAFVEAFQNADPLAAASVYADEAKLFAPWAELVRGRAAIESFWRTGVDMGLHDVELEAIELHGDSALAYEIGRYVLRLTAPRDIELIDRGMYVLVLERQPDGIWRRAVEVFNPEGPPSESSGWRPAT